MVKKQLTRVCLAWDSRNVPVVVRHDNGHQAQSYRALGEVDVPVTTAGWNISNAYNDLNLVSRNAPRQANSYEADEIRLNPETGFGDGWQRIKYFKSRFSRK